MQICISGINDGSQFNEIQQNSTNSTISLVIYARRCFGRQINANLVDDK